MAQSALTNVSVLANKYVDRGDPASWDFDTFTTDATWRDLDLSSIVPSGATAVHLLVRVQDDAAASEFSLRKNGNSNVVNKSVVSTQVTGIDVYQDCIISLDANAIVEYMGTNTTFTIIRIAVKGWWI